MSDDGGRVIPDWLVDKLFETPTGRSNPYWVFRPARRRLSRRDRLRVKVWDWRYRIARRIYPFMDADDD